MARVLNLRRTWVLGERIGGGGFGQVFLAHAEGASPAVAKLVPKQPGAQRELLFVELPGVRNVVPIVDSGETADHWVLVMPKADESLQQYIARSGPLDVPAAVAVLTDIATALVDLDGRVVHRDVKPANILFLNGRWCLADFGISRYADASTSPDTQKYALSPFYAAPERWRAERASAATDIYSLGIIAYELITGAVPFADLDASALRERHLHGRPPSIEAIPPALSALIEECLYKEPSARPTPANLLARLGRLGQSALPNGLSKLQKANLAEVVRQGEQGRGQSAARSEAEVRARLVDAAKASWARISEAMKDAITRAAPAAVITAGSAGSWMLRLGRAQLRCAAPVTTDRSPWGSWDRPAFQVVAHSSLSVQFPSDRYGYEGRSHSLWYCDVQEAERYRWFECAFMVSPMVPRQVRQNPFALEPGEAAAKALWTGMAEWQLAWPFSPIQPGETDDLIARWADWFADAAEGRLGQPSMMPERQAEGSWRRR